MNPEIEELKKAVSRNTRMEIPLRDVVDILAPKIKHTADNITDLMDWNDLIAINNDLHNYIDYRLRHQQLSELEQTRIAARLLNLSAYISKKVEDNVQRIRRSEKLRHPCRKE